MIRKSVFFVLTLASAFAQSQAPASRQLIRDVRIFDGKNVLHDGDPTTNILETRNIVAVWKRGVAVKRAAL